MNKNSNGKLHCFFKLYSFMRPYMLRYIPGLIVYCSQGFVFSFISSVFMSRITATMLDGDTRDVLYSALVFIAMFIIYLPILAVGILMYSSGELRAIRDLKAKLFRCFVNTSLESSMSSHSGEGIAAINTDADTASRVFDFAISPLLSCVISIVFSALVVFLVDYRLGLASIGIGLLAFLIQYKFAEPLGRIGEEKLSVNAGSVKTMSGIFSGALAIRAFNAQQKAIMSFDKENNKLLILSFKQAVISMWQIFFTTIQGWLTLTGVFALGGYLVATHRLSFPALMMVPSMCEAIAVGMSGIGAAWAGMQAPIAAGERIFDILESGASEEVSTLESAKSTSEDWNGNYTISISDMSFKYLSGAGRFKSEHQDLELFAHATGEDHALTGISLDIRENEMTAFVGESGSGKSTLLRTIIGLYDHEGLDMRIGNAHFNSKDIISWRNRFAYVDQSCKLFDMTVAENIALGGKSPSREEIREAAAGAYADDFINMLSDGYDTPCGENGASLSGGQKQRIAIARALVRKAPVLIFDEATSALDSESEKQIMDTINSLRSSHTILITTHNLNNIVNADKIVVMDKGRIVETGRHDQLMKSAGIYRNLYARQNVEHRQEI